MRNILPLHLLFIITLSVVAQDNCAKFGRAAVPSAIAGDGILRYYRLAIPVTQTSYIEDFDTDYNKVLSFWQECESFVNEAFVPLGLCFDVVEDESLVMSEYLPDEERDNFIYNLQANGTAYVNNLIADNMYDVGMWVHYRDIEAENSGLSVEGGVYRRTSKASGYAKADKWVVAHELGHMFGAPHTTTGEGSLMDSGGGNFFSYPSIKIIREYLSQKGTGTAFYETKVSNSAPEFVYSQMKGTYEIPVGACMAIPIFAKDDDGHTLCYSAMGCSSGNVDNIIEGGYFPHFATLLPRVDSLIDYRPTYTADIYYDDFYYINAGTDIPSLSGGLYDIVFIVNDIPASTDYSYLVNNPFYSKYTVWDSNVQVVDGEKFDVSISPQKSCYSAGEQVVIKWGVNKNYFTRDSRLRITISADYGKTFDYVLAESVPALDGQCSVVLPRFNIGNVDIDFVTAIRSIPGGVVRVEEVGGIAYSLSALNPERGGSFNITGGVDTSIEVISADDCVGSIYDIRGHLMPTESVNNLMPGIYIVDGKKVVVK